MSESAMYLRPNIQVEPLMDQWYAWPHLIPPATAARNLTDRHLKIMQSYISSPQLHVSAVRNPKMLGGPFVDHEVEKVGEIESLLSETVRNRSDLIELSNAISSLDGMIQTQARGLSLCELYERIPDILKGYVELSYDLNDHPNFRFIEPLLYKSKFYSKTTQSLMLSELTGDDRPFVLSTPRLESERSVHLKMSFDDDAVDYLFSLKRTPRPFGEIAERCRVAESSRLLFQSFFTPAKPPEYKCYDGEGLRWRYFGHACILVETGGVSLLFDPVLSYTYESGISRYTYNDLPDVLDYVLITHNHQDHVLLETLLQIRHKTRCVVVPKNGGGALQDPSLKLSLENIGFRNVLELGELQSIDIPKGTITGIPFFGEHADLDIRSKMAYLLNVRSNALLFAADSCNISPPLYTHIRDIFGDARSLFVGMECDGAPLSWLYGPLLTRHIERAKDQSRRLNGSNFNEAIAIVRALGCREVFVYAMGQEPWLRHIMSIKYSPESNPIVQSKKLLSECKEMGLLAEMLFGEREMYLD